MERYVLQADIEEIVEQFEVKSQAETEFEKNFNIKPGTSVPIVIEQNGSPKLVNATWGLKVGKDSHHSISQEEVLKDQNLKSLVESSACIIPASGFYKWKETVHDPLPFYLRVLSKEILPLAGICMSEKKEYRFAVITMPANALVEPLDKSMPCILDNSEYDQWLRGGALSRLEKGFHGNNLLPDMAVYRVPDLVNDTSKNSRELIQPIPKLRDDDD